MRPILSGALLFVAASGLMAAIYFLAAIHVFGETAALPRLVQAGTMLTMVVGFTYLAARLWDRWLTTFAVLSFLLGIGAMQTRFDSGDKVRDEAVAKGFKITGGVMAGGGVVTYLIARRRERLRA